VEADRADPGKTATEEEALKVRLRNGCGTHSRVNTEWYIVARVEEWRHTAVVSSWIMVNLMSILYVMVLVFDRKSSVITPPVTLLHLVARAKVQEKALLCLGSAIG